MSSGLDDRGGATGSGTAGRSRAATGGRGELMLAITQTLNATLTLETALERVLELTADAVDAAAVSVFVVGDDDQERLEVAFARRGGHLQTAAVSVALGLSGYVLQTGESVRVDDVSREPRFAGKLDRRFGTHTRALIAVPMRRGQRLIGLAEALREEPRPFAAEDADFIRAVADELAIAIENARLVERLQADVKEREVLLAAARKVGSSLDLAEVLDGLFSLLGELLPYDAGGVYLFDERTRRLEPVEHRGYPENTEQLLNEGPRRGITGWVAQHRQGVVVGDVREDPRYIEARPSSRSEIAVPIIHADRVIGVITLESDEEDAYSDRNLLLLEMVAGQVSSAIINARLHERELRHARISHELKLAREIQRELLPRRILRRSHLEAAGINVPSSAVGGDYYDYFEECAEHFGLAVADVSGHGLSAALLMATVRAGVRLSSGTCAGPSALAAQLNRLLYDSTLDNQFVSAVLALLDSRTGDFFYCNAGHNPPLLVGDEEDRLLEGGGLILGAFDSANYEERRLRLAPGDVLVFYTDGLTELENPDGEEFGLDRLADTVRQLRGRSPEQIIKGVREAARRHRDGAPKRDDITLMVARWR